MAKAQIVFPDAGLHNGDLPASRARLLAGQSYRDCSTVCLIPTRGGRCLIPKVVQSWMNMMSPMNQKFTRIFLEGMEVGDAYTQGLDAVFANPELSKWKYVLTLEDDNLPPPDGLLKLLESIQRYDAVGGLYWTRGEGGAPMIYGDVNDVPRNFRPQLPIPDTIQPCHGLGMGFTLFRMKMLKDPRLPKPLFKTRQEWDPQKGIACYTQDLAGFEVLGGLGYRFACDTRVKVGHYDADTGLTW